MLAVNGHDLASDRRQRPHLPGELGIWILVCGDLVVFSVLFAAFLVSCLPHKLVFDQSQLLLARDIAAVNTCVLLTGSWFVVGAVRAVQANRLRPAKIRLLATILCGITFVSLKIFEYHSELAAGITPQSNDFFMFYYVITGIHLAHVVLGLSLLGWIYKAGFRAKPPNLKLIETGATFWHFVDILWVMIFPLLYLAR